MTPTAWTCWWVHQAHCAAVPQPASKPRLHAAHDSTHQEEQTELELELLNYTEDYTGHTLHGTTVALFAKALQLLA
jgi:hypothetical protein